ncbi:MAG: hypothetical protein EOO30_20515 [Comamonadaceae bacterium]|nr:MAG: hypothetical protein EOO30_20515 [Comamonadaceae bacterium]
MNEPRTESSLHWEVQPALLNPFQESFGTSEDKPRAPAFAGWSEASTPFAEVASPLARQSDSERLFAEALGELRDEAFDEALAFLAEETEQAVADRFTNEAPLAGPERERYAENYLSPVRFEAEQYLDSLHEGLAGMDIASLSEQQVDEVLERFDPQPRDLSPAAEEFIGKLVRKAKSAVKVVAKAAGAAAKVAGKLATPLLGPVLKKLRGLVQPLLRRVLAMAIGRLPAALQPAARKVAAQFPMPASEQEEFEGDAEAGVSPANLTDVAMLAESFDAAIAQSLAFGADQEEETFAGARDEVDAGSRELEALALARADLIERIRNAGDEEDLAPAIEQFVPAVLGALRLGISLAGRPKVVGFLANYVGQLIKRWVGPEQSRPLATAIVDTGLRLATLEAEAGGALELSEDEAGPVALASVVEDAVRRLAEQDEFVLESEELMQLATADAFSEAVASHFPGQLLRSDLQQAPSLGGTFVARRPRAVRTYSKYSRVPEVDITPQVADALPAFGGSTVGASLRAAGATLPMRARMHIYQATSGTTVPSTLRQDRGTASAGSAAHPLTPGAAGLLLREPKLGVAVPPAYLQSRHRIAAGQRFYVLEPIGEAAGLVLPATPAVRTAPSRATIRVNQRRGRATVTFYLSEDEAQAIAAAIRKGRGAQPLLQALTAAWRAVERTAAATGTPVPVQREDEDLAAVPRGRSRQVKPSLAAQLRRVLARLVLPALAEWSRTGAEAFARAAAHPEPGVTLRVTLTSVPGLAASCASCGSATLGKAGGSMIRTRPPVAVSVQPGRPRA